MRCQVEEGGSTSRMGLEPDETEGELTTMIYASLLLLLLMLSLQMWVVAEVFLPVIAVRSLWWWHAFVFPGSGIDASMFASRTHR